MSGNHRPAIDGEKRVYLNFRILPSDLADITRRAEALGLTRTDYMIRAALRQPLGDEGTDDLLADHDRRLSRIEDRLFGSYE